MQTEQMDSPEDHGVLPPEERMIRELTPRSRRFNLTARVLEVGESREVPSRNDEPAKRLQEVRVADETGTVLMTLWDDQIGELEPDREFTLENGHVTLVRGRIRVSTGRYGKIADPLRPIGELNTQFDASDYEYDRPPRHGGRSPRGGGGRSGGRWNSRDERPRRPQQEF